MIETLAPKAPDPLLKIIKMFREDPRSDKIDLGVGVYRDASGNTPVMAAVKEAEARLHRGAEDEDLCRPARRRGVSEAGRRTRVRRRWRAISFRSRPSAAPARCGWAAICCARAAPSASCCRTPCWPNHPAIVRAARLEPVDVPFFNIAEQRIDMDALIAGFADAERGDAVILQACCHNPLGADFSLAQWEALADALQRARLIPFVDLAYQGFGDGIDEDVAGVRALLARVPEAVIAVSEAKSFGIYRERVGALLREGAGEGARGGDQQPRRHRARELFDAAGPRRGGRARSAERRGAARSRGARSSTTSAHTSSARARCWRRRAINSIPMHLIAAQKGMFSTLPLRTRKSRRCARQHGIYMTDAARINVAGLREADIPRFVEALKAVA